MLGDSHLFVRMAGSGFFHRVVRFNSVLYQKKKKVLGLVRISQVLMIFIFKNSSRFSKLSILTKVRTISYLECFSQTSEKPVIKIFLKYIRER